MPVDLERAIVRIYGPQSGVAGSGFLVAPSLILTCAHVVKEAPMVTLDFPLVAAGQKCGAQVICSDPRGDIAVLKVETLPPAAEPVRLVILQETWDHPCGAFGFPKGHPGGVWAKGVLRGPIGDTGWLQIDADPKSAYFVEAGFSGTPVWDDEAHGVVGMVVTKELASSVRVAFCIPTHQLIAFWTDLKEQAIPSNPYRGLLAFREKDAPFFFGREAFSDRLVNEVEKRALTTVVGPSGCGKSSVAFAGLLPRLRLRPDWTIVTLRPGNQPFLALAEAVLPFLEATMTETDRLREVPKLADALRSCEISLDLLARRILQKHGKEHLLMLVDQFEELFTLCPEDYQHSFLNCLLRPASISASSAPSPLSPLHLVFTLRADFMGQALSYRPFADALDGRTLLLGLMNREELERAIVRPAEVQGVTFEEGLVVRILEDVGEEPGNLPLLEFALTQLWEQQEEGRLTHVAYDAVGGVMGALFRYAEEVYNGLDEAEQEQTRRVFVQLVRPGEGTEDTRRRATRAELGEECWAVARKLANARLVVTGRDPSGQEIAEMAHEALIQGWGRLRGWMAEDRDFRVWQERTRVDYLCWQESGRDEGALLRGVPLAQALDWLKKRGDEVEGAVQEFIHASVEKAEAERQARERLQRRIVMGLAIGFVITLLLAFSALVQRNQAIIETNIRATAQAQAEERRQAAEAARSTAIAEAQVRATAEAQAEERRQEAERQSRIAAARRLAIQAQKEQESSEEGLELSVLLASESMLRFHSVAADRVLRRGLALLPRRMFCLPPEYFALELALSPDGSLLATSGDGLFIWDAVSGQKLARFALDHVDTMLFSPDGTRFVVTGGKAIRLLDTTTFHELTNNTYEDWARSPVFSPSGAYLAIVVGNSVRIWNAVTGQEISSVPYEDRSHDIVVFSPNDTYVATVTNDGVHLWDVTTGQELRYLALKEIYRILFNSDGTYLATIGEGEVRLWEVASGQERGMYRIGGAEHHDLAFAPGERLLVATVRSSLGFAEWIREVRVTDVISKQDNVLVYEKLESTKEEVNVIFSLDGTRLVIASSKGMQLLDTATGQEIARLDLSGWWLRFSPDAQYLVVERYDTLIFWDLSRNQKVAQVPLAGFLDYDIAFDSERIRVVVTSGGQVCVWQAPGDPGLVSLGNDGARISVSSDGRFVAYSEGVSTPNKVHIWNAADGQEIGALLHTREIYHVVFSPDGKRIVTSSGDRWRSGEVNIWEATSGRKLAAIPFQWVKLPPPSGLPSIPWGLLYLDFPDFIAFDTDVRRLATPENDRIVRLWDAMDGQFLGRLPHTWLPGRLTAPTFTPDGRRIATVIQGNAWELGRVCIWDTSTGRNEICLPHQNQVENMVFNTDGTRLATADENAVYLWNALTGERLFGIESEWPEILFDPKGIRLAIAAHDSSLRLWDATTGEEMLTWPVEDRAQIAFSPDGEFFAASDGYVARLWNASTGEEILNKSYGSSYEEMVSQIAFSHNSAYLAMANGNTVHLWKTSTGQDLVHLSHDEPINNLVFSNDDTILATFRSGYEPTKLYLWNIPAGQELARLPHDQGPYLVRFSPDDTRLATASLDETVRLWNVATGEELARLPHEYLVRNLDFSPDGSQFVTSIVGDSRPKDIHVWDTVFEREVAVLPHERQVYENVFSPDGRYLVTVTRDDQAHLWDLNSSRKMADMPHEWFESLLFSPDSKYLLAFHPDNRSTYLWDISAHKEVLLPGGYVALSPNSEYVVVTTSGEMVALWNTLTEEEITRLPYVRDSGYGGVAFSPDSKYLIVTASEGVTLWETATGRKLALLTSAAKLYSRILFDPGSRRLITVGDKRDKGISRSSEVVLWDIPTGREIIRLDHDGYWENTHLVTLSPDGRYFTTVHGGELSLRSITDGHEVARLLHDNSVDKLAFAPDSTSLAVATDDGAVHLWSTGSGKELIRLWVGDKVANLMFGPDKGYMVVVGSAGRVSIWDITSGQEVSEIIHEQAVDNLFIGPNGKYVITVTRNGSAQLWLWRTEDLIAAACARLTRNLTEKEWTQHVGPEVPYHATCPTLSSP